MEGGTRILWYGEGVCDGLDLVYSVSLSSAIKLKLVWQHFLTPIIASLDMPEPLLHRSALTSIFSNFIDTWNFHRSFLSSLTTLLAPPPGIPSTSSSSSLPWFDQPIPPLVASSTLSFLLPLPVQYCDLVHAQCAQRSTIASGKESLTSSRNTQMFIKSL